MAREKVSKAEFFEKAGHLLADPNNPPKIREIAKATGLSEGGVYYKLLRYGIRRKVRWTMQDAT